MKKFFSFSETKLSIEAGMLMFMLLLFNAGWLKAQTVTTDKADYVPGETVIITGTGWMPGETISLYLEKAPPVSDPETKYAIADAMGNFSNSDYIVKQVDLGVTFTLTALGLTSGSRFVTTFTDAGGDYSIDFSGYDPSKYKKTIPGSVVAPVGRGISPLNQSPDKMTFHANTIESLQPADLGLGQIVAYEFFITAGGSCPNDVIEFMAQFGTKTTSGDNIGFDVAYKVVAAFVDTDPTDGAFNDPDGDASVSFSSSLSTDFIEGTFDVSGLDPGDKIPVEVWVALDTALPEGTIGGNVPSNLESAKTLGICEPAKAIGVGTQTVPLSKPSDFITANVDVQITKTDLQDPVDLCGQIQYTINLSNSSSIDNPSVANTIVISDTLDDNTTFLGPYTITDNTGTTLWSFNQAGQILTFSTGFLDIGELVTITFPVSVACTAPHTGTGGPGGTGICTTGDIRNTVSVTTISNDNDLTNNEYCQPTGVSCTTTPPVFTSCPLGSNLGCNPTEFPDPGTAVATAISGTPVINVSDLGDPVNADGCTWSRSYTFTATDGCGNTATCIQTFVYTVDLTLPEFMACPEQSIALGCNPEQVPNETMAITAAGRVTDLCGTPVLSAVGGTVAEDCMKSQIWTVTATDGCGNSATCSVTFTWTTDHTPPVFTACPEQSIALGCNPEQVPNETMAIAAAGTVNDLCGMPVLSALGGAIAEDCMKSQVWTVTATDGCGNSATCSVTFTWTTDHTPPVFTACPEQSIALGCNPEQLPDETMAITAAGRVSDLCGTPVLSALGGAITGDCMKSQIWTVTATDDCTNSAMCSVTFTWKTDSQLPVISTLAANGDLGCNPKTTTPVFMGLDNCDGEFNPEIATGGPGNSGCSYTQTWTANYTDACGNAANPVSITYTWKVDTEKPVLATTATGGDLGCNPTVPTFISPKEGNTNSTTAGLKSAKCIYTFTGTDNCEGNIIPVVTTAGATHTGCAYTQTWTANYTDACGNAADPLSITYTWKVDTEKPVLSTTATGGDLGCNPVIPTFITPKEGSTKSGVTTAGVKNAKCIYTFSGTDNCEGNIAPVVSTSGAIKTGCAYTQTWTANYTDACGNAADPLKITFTWTVDTEKPVITLANAGNPGNNPSIENIAAAFGTASVSDNCSTGLTATGTIGAETESGGTFSITKNWTVTDACGNTGTASQTVTYTRDSKAPVIISPLEDPSFDCGEEIVIPTPVFTSDCPGAIAVNCIINGIKTNIADYTFPVGISTVCFSATDACGNTSAPECTTVSVSSCDGLFSEINSQTSLQNPHVTIAPNPFNEQTRISFRLMKNTKVSLEIYNLIGSKIATLFEGPAEQGKDYSFTFSPAIHHGTQTFMCILRTTFGTTSERIILSR